jgi:hypothetical protein
MQVYGHGRCLGLIRASGKPGCRWPAARSGHVPLQVKVPSAAPIPVTLRQNTLFLSDPALPCNLVALHNLPL